MPYPRLPPRNTLSVQFVILSFSSASEFLWVVPAERGQPCLETVSDESHRAVIPPEILREMPLEQLGDSWPRTPVSRSWSVLRSDSAFPGSGSDGPRKRSAISQELPARTAQLTVQEADFPGTRSKRDQAGVPTNVRALAVGCDQVREHLGAELDCFGNEKCRPSFKIPLTPALSAHLQ